MTPDRDAIELAQELMERVCGKGNHARGLTLTATEVRTLCSPILAEARTGRDHIEAR